jgi:2,4-dienoyl-CoA reductase-like NADH-dependent reductase (Old Yellow Enzyme family)
VGVQLAHAGRKASSQFPWQGGGALTNNSWKTFGPSAVAFDNGWHTPQALDDEGLARIKDAFVAAALRALRIDLDVVELHSAHGYLLHQFLSPLSNQRIDAYGGSLENRMRYPLEVFDAVRSVWPDNRPLLVRVSASDWVDGGWDITQTTAYVKELLSRHCSAVHVSSGGNSPLQQISVGPGYQTEFAAVLKKQVDIPVIAVGMIIDPYQAETIIKSGQADMVGLAREFLRDPHWTWRAAKALRSTSSVPLQYQRAISFD